MNRIGRGRGAFCGALLVFAIAASASAADYCVYSSWSEMDKAIDAKYADVTRVSGEAGYTGFWFFGAEQFDASNHYALAMTVYFKDRDVRKEDAGDIGYFDLQDRNKWTRIGTTTAQHSVPETSIVAHTRIPTIAPAARSSGGWAASAAISRSPRMR